MLLKLTQDIITNGSDAPKARIELCDTDLPGLYIEVRATSPAKAPTTGATATMSLLRAIRRSVGRLTSRCRKPASRPAL